MYFLGVFGLDKVPSIVWFFVFVLLMFIAIKLFAKFCLSDSYKTKPLSEYEISLAVKYNLFDGDVERIKSEMGDVRLAIYEIRDKSIIKNDGFDYSLFYANDCVRIDYISSFKKFVNILYERQIPYYSYMKENRIHDEHGETDYYIRVANKDFKEVQNLFDEMNLTGSKFLRPLS